MRGCDVVAGDVSLVRGSERCQHGVEGSYNVMYIDAVGINNVTGPRASPCDGLVPGASMGFPRHCSTVLGPDVLLSF